MPEVTCTGNNQIGRPGRPLKPFEAFFRDEQGEPVIGIPVKFILAKGEGELTESSETTDYSGGVCAELIPDGKTRSGRVELHYGEKLECMIPFLYMVRETEETEEAVTLPPATETTPPPPRPQPARPVVVPAPRKKAKSAPPARRTGRLMPALSRIDRLIGSQPRLVLAAIAIIVLGLLMGARKMTSQPSQSPAELIADCDHATARRTVNGETVLICPLYRK